MNHVAPTANIVERLLFSRTKLVMTDQSKLLAPDHLELLLFFDAIKIYEVQIFRKKSDIHRKLEMK